MTLRQVKMICAICNQNGVAQIDTTENVLLMVCLCPNCSTYRKPDAEAGLAELFG